MHDEFKYADLLDDDVFKLVFGRESSKDVMLEFLNQVIDDRTIVDLDFMDKEMKSHDRTKKDSVYDMFCRTDDGSRIIVEVQRRKQPFYPERSLYYSTFQIQSQVDSGAADYGFLPVYVINILNFNLDVNDCNPEVKTVYRLYEKDNHTLLTDRLTFIFLELKKFQKTIDELNGNILEGICFCLKHMPMLSERPDNLDHDIFRKIFEVSELLKMDEETRSKVIHKMTTERDLRNQMAYARQEAIEEGREEGRAIGLEMGIAEGRAEGIAEGRAEGIAEGRAEGIAEGSREKALEIAKSLKQMGMSIDDISRIVGLDSDLLEKTIF